MTTAAREPTSVRRQLPWVEHPFIYELDTWVWLGELGRQPGAQLGLGEVPGRGVGRVAALGFDAVWLMGVWERSPAGIAIALENDALVASFERRCPTSPTPTWSARRTASAATRSTPSSAARRARGGARGAGAARSCG